MCISVMYFKKVLVMLFCLCAPGIFQINAEASTTISESIGSVLSGLNFMLGKCPATHYYAKAQNCSKAFFENIRSGKVRIANCSEKYLQLRQCMLTTFTDCMKDSLLRSFLTRQDRLLLIDNYLQFFGDERLWCEQGGLAIPQYLPRGTTCHPIYGHLTKGCVTPYQRMFNSRTSLSKLCREYNKARTCLQRSLVNHCSFNTNELAQVIEISIEAEANFQPFCQSPLMNPRDTFRALLDEHKCPPHSHTDVLFVADVSSETSNEELASMKQAIEQVTNKLEYGKTGIHVGYAQFHERTSLSIRMNSRIATKQALVRRLARIRRLYTSNQRRYTGRSLRQLSNTLRSGTSSLTRPFHTPVCVVFTTGPSDDKRLSSTLKLFKERKIHLVRFGPHLVNRREAFSSTYRIDETRNFTKHAGDILYEICEAERNFHPGMHSGVTLQELTDDQLLLNRISSFFLRARTAHLPLFWQPEELVIQEDDMRPMQEDRQNFGIGTIQEARLSEDFDA